MNYDNQRVVHNTILPQYNLVNKHKEIKYDVVGEAAAAGIVRVGKEDTETNLADLLKNILGWK